MSKSVLKIGITGGIGSGKSTIAKVFQILGIPTYSADDRAKWLMSNDLELRGQILESFGSESFLPSGELNRSFLAKTVFPNPEKAAKINSLVHPAVGRDFEVWSQNQTSPYVLKEAALIFETGGETKLDAVINVSAPLKIRVTRVLLRDKNRSEEQVNQIINQQLPDEIKNEKATFVIKNGPNKLIIPQVLAIHKKLISKEK